LPPVISGVVPSASVIRARSPSGTRPIVEQPAQPIRGGTIDVVGDVREEPDSEHRSAVPETTLQTRGCSPLATMREVATRRRP
jgi:hypothetical protein